MGKTRRMEASLRTVALFAAAMAVTDSVEARQLTPRIVTSSFDDDELIVSGGSAILLTQPGEVTSNGKSRLFTMDSCGMPRMSGSALLTRSSLGSPLDDFDEEDPRYELQELFGRWFAVHPEVAVISDGVDKSCDESPLDDPELGPDLDVVALRANPQSFGGQVPHIA